MANKVWITFHPWLNITTKCYKCILIISNRSPKSQTYERTLDTGIINSPTPLPSYTPKFLNLTHQIFFHLSLSLGNHTFTFKVLNVSGINIFYFYAILNFCLIRIWYHPKNVIFVRRIYFIHLNGKFNIKKSVKI